MENIAKPQILHYLLPSSFLECRVLLSLSAAMTEAVGKDSGHFCRLLQLKRHSFRIFNHEVLDISPK